MNISDHNRRVSYLKFRKQCNTITDAEFRELRESVILVGGVSDDPNVRAMPAAFPAYQPTLQEWLDDAARASRREESVITIQSDEPQSPGDDTTGPDFTDHTDPATGDVVTLAQPGFDPPHQAERKIVKAQGRTLHRGA
jgi:hypothetical protein